MEFKLDPNKTYLYVDEDGKAVVLQPDSNVVFEDRETYICVMPIDSDGIALGEYVLYQSA